MISVGNKGLREFTFRQVFMEKAQDMAEKWKNSMIPSFLFVLLYRSSSIYNE
jgi:hypothetical protein